MIATFSGGYVRGIASGDRLLLYFGPSRVDVGSTLELFEFFPAGLCSTLDLFRVYLIGAGAKRYVCDKFVFVWIPVGRPAANTSNHFG